MLVHNAGTGNISKAVVTDNLPIIYADYQAGTIVYFDEAGTAHPKTDGAIDDSAKWASPTITANVGGVTPPFLPNDGGDIIPNASVSVVYQVKVK